MAISTPAAASSNPPNLDVNKLLASLAAGGLLPVTAPSPAPSAAHVSTPQDYLSNPKSMIYRLYEAQPLQCKTCGLRFDDDKRDALRQHMDWHFRRNMRLKGSGKIPLSRRWWLPVDEWLKHDPNQETDVEKPSLSVFDSLEQDAKIGNTPQSADVDVPVSPCLLRLIDTPSISQLSDGIHADAGARCSTHCVQSNLLPMWGRGAYVLGF